MLICFHKGFHYARLNSTKIQACSMIWRQHDIHWIRSGKEGIYRAIWCRYASVSVTVEKKAALLEGTIHRNQLIRCRSSARKPAYLNRIFYSYVIKHCKLWSLFEKELTQNGREGFVSSWISWLYLVHAVEFRWFPDIESLTRAQSISNEHLQGCILSFPSSSL